MLAASADNVFAINVGSGLLFGVICAALLPNKD